MGAGCILPLASKAQGSPITDAYRQLRLLSSSTQGGVSYNSYGEEWRKTLGLIDIAIEDSKPSKLTEKLAQIKSSYSDISNIWGCRFSSKYISIAIDYCLTPGFKDRNPAVMAVLRKQVSANEFVEMESVTPAIIPVLFGLASTQVRELGEMLKKK